MSKLHQDNLVIWSKFFIDDVDKSIPILLGFSSEKEYLFIVGDSGSAHVIVFPLLKILDDLFKHKQRDLLVDQALQFDYLMDVLEDHIDSLVIDRAVGYYDLLAQIC